MSNPNEVRPFKFIGQMYDRIKDKLVDVIEECKDGKYVCYSDYQSLGLENKLLRTALEKYGKHLDSCQYDRIYDVVDNKAVRHETCDCGFEQALGGKE